MTESRLEGLERLAAAAPEEPCQTCSYMGGMSCTARELYDEARITMPTLVAEVRRLRDVIAGPPGSTARYTLGLQAAALAEGLELQAQLKRVGGALIKACEERDEAKRAQVEAEIDAREADAKAEEAERERVAWKEAHTERQAEIENLRGQLIRVCEERDAARRELADLKSHRVAAYALETVEALERVRLLEAAVEVIREGAISCICHLCRGSKCWSCRLRDALAALDAKKAGL